MTILRGFTPTLSVNAIHQVSLDLFFPQAVWIPIGIMSKKQLSPFHYEPH